MSLQLSSRSLETRGYAHAPGGVAIATCDWSDGLGEGLNLDPLHLFRSVPRSSSSRTGLWRRIGDLNP